jgi:hypothetical protein
LPSNQVFNEDISDINDGSSCEISPSKPSKRWSGRWARRRPHRWPLRRTNRRSHRPDRNRRPVPAARSPTGSARTLKRRRATPQRGHPATPAHPGAARTTIAARALVTRHFSGSSRLGVVGAANDDTTFSVPAKLVFTPGEVQPNQETHRRWPRHETSRVPRVLPRGEKRTDNDTT